MPRFILYILFLSLFIHSCKCTERIAPTPPPQIIEVPGVSFEVTPMPTVIFQRDTTIIYKDSITQGTAIIRTVRDTMYVKVDCPAQEIIVQPEPYEVIVREKVIHWPLVLIFAAVISLILFRLIR